MRGRVSPRVVGNITRLRAIAAGRSARADHVNARVMAGRQGGGEGQSVGEGLRRGRAITGGLLRSPLPEKSLAFECVI